LGPSDAHSGTEQVLTPPTWTFLGYP
jgi:hypothetical protein